MITYFAYGSNMLTERIGSRVRDANPIGIAQVSGRRLTFHKISTRQSGSRSGKCDICMDSNPNAVVYGVLFEIPKPQFDELNTHEGGYSIVELAVDSPKLGSVSAVAHVANTTDATLVPYDWYRDLVLEGALQHGLPEPYIQEFIQNIMVEETGLIYKDAREAKALVERIRSARNAANNK